ncbi:unnamed protein product [Notodromas monacha]|nr:unnamed protein product [Notodromas monacha]CAG0920856.1 unnamed protein product [Notodromas monacha]
MGSSLSKHQQQALKKSWASVQPRALVMGRSTFVEVLSKYPEYKARFPRLKDVPGDQLQGNKALDIHVILFTQAVRAMVENVEDFELVDEVARRIAYRHVRMGIDETDLDVVTAGFIAKVADGSDDVWHAAAKCLNHNIADYMRRMKTAGDNG